MCGLVNGIQCGRTLWIVNVVVIHVVIVYEYSNMGRVGSTLTQVMFGNENLTL